MLATEEAHEASLVHTTSQATPARFLMCPPRHFAVSYSINPWMDPDAWTSAAPAQRETAERQWSALHGTLLAHGAVIDFVEPEPDLPDLVFTANAAVVLDGKVLLARFRHSERQGEEPIFGAAFEALQARADLSAVISMPEDLCLEGAGDCIWDPACRQFWMGFGPRSHEASAHVVADVFGRPCVALELADPSFYHLDTAFCPLPSGDLIYYPGAFTQAGQRLIEERVAPAQRIELDRADAKQFSANAVAFDHCIVLSSCSEDLRGALQDRGFAVITSPLQAFLQSGGSACCLTLRLDHRSDGA